MLKAQDLQSRESAQGLASELVGPFYTSYGSLLGALKPEVSKDAASLKASF